MEPDCDSRQRDGCVPHQTLENRDHTVKCYNFRCYVPQTSPVDTVSLSASLPATELLPRSLSLSCRSAGAHCCYGCNSNYYYY